jgi:peptidoglycan L-alanyl-D-glutamate endopeptidase CwlK
MQLTATSERRLVGVHPDLVRVVRRCARKWPNDGTSFVVTEGVRLPGRQAELVAAGASQTKNSRHLRAPNGYSHAVDLAIIVGGKATWEFPLYVKLNDRMQVAAKAERVPIKWGGAWRTLKDGPHFQLPRDRYPGTTKEK